jgi:hypothetical protein
LVIPAAHPKLRTRPHQGLPGAAETGFVRGADFRDAFNR